MVGTEDTCMLLLSIACPHHFFLKIAYPGQFAIVISPPLSLFFSRPVKGKSLYLTSFAFFASAAFIIVVPHDIDDICDGLHM